MNAEKIDQRIQDEIQHELRCLPGIDHGSVGVSVEACVVSLTGHLANDSVRQAAERLARGVHGVRSVTNEIRIHPTLRDAQHEASLIRAVSDAFGKEHQGH